MLMLTAKQQRIPPRFLCFPNAAFLVQTHHSSAACGRCACFVPLCQMYTVTWLVCLTWMLASLSPTTTNAKKPKQTNFFQQTAYSNAPRPAKPKYFITACAMIKNELNVILEWIEFHRLQGVDHFVFLDDESSDDMYLLPRLYTSLGHPDLVEIIPQNFRKRQQPTDHSYSDYLDGQMQGLQHCNTRFRGVTEWLLMSDVDEFIFSPKYYTIANYLRNVTDAEAGEVYARALRYGSAGVMDENRVRFAVDPYLGQVIVVNDVYNGEMLLTARNTRRAPHPRLEADYMQRFNATCRKLKYREDCHHNNGKALWRPTKCAQAGVHYCETGLSGESVEPLLSELRVNHYAFRSKQRMTEMGKIEMGQLKVFVFKMLDKPWFSSVEDDSIGVYREEVLRRLEAFPTISIFHRRTERPSASEWITSFFGNTGKTALYLEIYSLNGLIFMVLCFFLGMLLGRCLLFGKVGRRKNSKA